MFYVSSVEGQNMRTYNEYGKWFTTNYDSEWQSIFEDGNLESLKKQALSGNFQHSRIRSVYWRILLGVYPKASPSDLIDCVNEGRNKYNLLKASFTLDPHQSTMLPGDNPLSQDKNSVWYQFFCDSDLKKTISQDVVRTSLDCEFIRSESVQEMMTNILFCYARNNPDISYKQGMHEILAPIIYILHQDSEWLSKTHFVTSELRSLASHVLDSAYLEQDAFYLFSQIMNHMKMYYNSIIFLPNGENMIFPDDNTSHLYESPIYEHLETIKNTLASYDLALYNHLIKLKISFTSFGIRWLRLLFGAEFRLCDLLLLWDAIFAINSNFTLVRFILISMLIAIREKLINSDYMHCVALLMKYPDDVDITFVIDYAVYLKEPMLHPKPILSSYVICPEVGFSSTADDAHENVKKSNTVLSRKTKMFPFNSKTKKTVKGINSFEYPTKDIDVLTSKLEHMHVVMSLCRLKLNQYHDILNVSIASNDYRAQQALTGIQELCSLMDISNAEAKQRASLSPDVEAACEADEVTVPLAPAPDDSLADQLKASTMVRFPRGSVNDMQVFRVTENLVTDPARFPAVNPLRLSCYDD